MTSSPPRIALIGVGHLGSRHLKILNDLRDRIQLVAVCDLKESRTRRLARHYGVPFVNDFKRLDGRVDAVDICVPTCEHHRIARHFLRQGVDVFIEKPMAATLDEADDLIALAERNKRLIAVGHVERYNAAFEAVVRIVRRRHRPLFIESHRLGPFPKRSLDVGVVLDLMIHDLDIILGLDPGPLYGLHAVGVPVLTAFEDIASVRLVFQSGLVCNLTASRVSDETLRKIRIFLEDRYISLDYVQQEAYVTKRRRNGVIKHALPIEKEEPLRKELDDWIAALRHRRPPKVDGATAREALALALRITERIRANSPFQPEIVTA